MSEPLDLDAIEHVLDKGSLRHGLMAARALLAEVRRLRAAGERVREALADMDTALGSWNHYGDSFKAAEADLREAVKALGESGK